MTNFIAKKAAQKIFKEHAGNQNGSADPYFEYVAATDMNGRATGKTVKRKRGVPPGLTRSEEKILKKVTRRAYRLDNAFNFCGIKVGWGAIIGLIPVLGDFADTLLAMMVFRTCTQAKIPAAVQSKMTFNIVLDFLIGLVPVLGDFADALWRANTKNAALLYEHLEQRGAERLSRGEVPADGSRQNSPARSHGVVNQQPHVKEQMPSSHGRKQQSVPQPQPARTNTAGFLDRFNPLASRTRDADLENAEGGYHGPAAGHAAGHSRGQSRGRQETGRTGRH